jgi:WD40 repeat protein
MDPLYDLHSWCKHYRGETQREAQVRHRPLPQLTSDRSTPIGGKFQWVIAWVFVAVLVALLMALAGARPAQAAFPKEALPVNHNPIAFEKDGDIWLVTRMRLANLTPNPPNSYQGGPVVSPDGRYVTFVSDLDGPFVHYVANVFTGDVQRSPITR